MRTPSVLQIHVAAYGVACRNLERIGRSKRRTRSQFVWAAKVRRLARQALILSAQAMGEDAEGELARIHFNEDGGIL